MPEICSLNVAERDGVAVATLEGEVDVSNADELGAELRTRVSNRVLAVIVDLSGVEYIDSYGLSFLFDLNRRLKTRQQELRVVIPEGAHTRRVLEFAGFTELAGLDGSLADARTSLEQVRDADELAQ
jgi:anti-anti-sigma factor